MGGNIEKKKILSDNKKHTIAIMQPTFLPWIGYFDLIDQADAFVFLDNVDFTKQSWQQRNRIKTANGVQWLTVPILWRGHSGQKILDVKINQAYKYKEKHIKTITQSYCKAPFFNLYVEEFSNIFVEPYQKICKLNIDLIVWLCKKLGMETTFIRSSELEINGDKVERLINICRAFDADCYLSPPGSREYIEENNLFISNNIELMYHNFQHPHYSQLHGDFVPYLSVIDLIFNEGPNSLDIIRNAPIKQ